MPYDSRPVSEGGNRGIDDRFSRKAPPGQFRVVGVDTFDGNDWHDDDFNEKADAIKRAKEKTEGKSMLKYYIYDDAGDCVGSYGDF